MRAGAKVAAFVRYTASGSAGALRFEEEAAEMELFRGDLRDADAVATAVQGREIVLHLGALVGIPYSYASPRDVVETNVGGTLNVLQAARAHGPGLVLCMSTSEVYGTPEALPISERTRLMAQSPYAASKVAAASNGSAVEIWRDGSAVRSYTYVADMVDRIFRLMHSDLEGAGGRSHDPDAGTSRCRRAARLAHSRT